MMSFVPDPQSANTHTLQEHVDIIVAQYLEHIGAEQASNVYQMIIEPVESAILRTVFQHLKGHQTQMAQALGLSRSTLRKKLKQHGLIT